MKAIVFLCLLGTAAAEYSWNGRHTTTTGPPSGTIKPRDIGNLCLTDQASCGCCLMQQRMYKMETYFNDSMDALQADLNAALKVLNSVKASRSAFSVALTDERKCLGEFRDDKPVIYEVVLINLGGGYDTSNGIYTVPMSGVYSIAVTVYSDSGSGGNDLAACARLLVNEKVIARPRDNNKQDQEDSATVVVALALKAGDKVHVQLPVGCFLCDNDSHYNTFTGFLLYATA